MSFLRKIFPFLFPAKNEPEDHPVPGEELKVTEPKKPDTPIQDNPAPGEEKEQAENPKQSGGVESIESKPTSNPKPISGSIPPQPDSSDKKKLIDWNIQNPKNPLVDVNKPLIGQTLPPNPPPENFNPPPKTFEPPLTNPPNSMKICPKTGEQMKEIDVLGEKIDVSSAGCYFDRGELTRILGSKPTFLQSIGNFLSGKGNPYDVADRGAEIMLLQQNIQSSRARLENLVVGSPEYHSEYETLRSLNAKMQGMNR